MRTVPQLRKRYPADNPPFGVQVIKKPGPAASTVPGFLRILQGAFGFGAPTARSSDPNEIGNPKPTSLYHYHEGDIFEPGTGNWILEPTFDGPINPVWGNGVSYPMVWSITSQPVLMAHPTTVTNGLGGEVAGQLALQPLIDPLELGGA